MTEPSASPVVLISHQMLGGLERPLLERGYRVLRRWESTPAQLESVEAIVHAGEVPLGLEVLVAMPGLQIIACVSVGYDGIDVDWCRARGIEVTHADGLNADDVADHAVGLLIASWRNILTGDRLVRSGEWKRTDRLARPSLKGRLVGVVGLGAIGAAVARRVEAFGMQVAWWGPRPKSAPWPMAESLLELAQASDILVVACRADEASRGIIAREIIEAVGPRGLIVNVARGSVVDEDALIEALKAGRLGRAALDVFIQEPTPAERWQDVPGVILTPHTAGATLEAIPAMIGQALENLSRHFAGEPLLSPVPE